MRRFLSLLLILPLLAACAARAQPAPLKLPVEKIVIDTKNGPRTFTVEVAADPKSQERGLMYRKQMADDAGMLFDFHRSQPVAFWMENTLIPLDMLFVRRDGTIANIRENAEPLSRESIPSFGDVQVVVEINGGLSRKLGIVAGGKVRAPQLRNMPVAVK